ncbi:MAG: DnaJ domain-containing protein [Anaerosomatales bacterium]|nr:DnaJ domain-containing protein [Anaerosomatales bacterium]
MRDCYEILQVSPDADPEVIEKAYRVLARKRHPDARPGDRRAHEMMIELNEAYAILSDPQRRAAYDRERAQRRRVPEALYVFWDSGLIGLYRRYGR